MLAVSAKATQLIQSVIAAFPQTFFFLTQIKKRLHLETSQKSPKLGNESSAQSGLDMPVRPIYLSPKLPLVLCHGLFGFDKLGPRSFPLLQIHYWGGIQEALQKIGAQVIVTKVPRTGGIRSRARELHRTLEKTLAGSEINLLAHSMGGLDCRYLIAHLPPEKCTIRSLTTVGTPHRGSPFMDWCRDNFGLGLVSGSFGAVAKAEDPSSLHHENNDYQPTQKSTKSSICSPNRQHNSISSPTERDENSFKGSKPLESSNDKKSSTSSSKNKKLFPNINIPHISIQNMPLPHISLPSLNVNLPNILSSSIPLTRTVIQAVDAPAYANLTTEYCINHFNPNTPNDPSVAYYSYGAATDIPIWSPLYFPHQIIKAKEGPNDGLVSVKSARWGRYVRTVDCDHWDLTDRWRFKFGNDQFDPVEFYLSVATFLAREGY
ncbi:hypothetical protein G9A89_010519 [Geosiphon pyriformis]|nr:hypothetical protein G9A89_010519 [Geosiphon pyriformis]